MVQIVLMITVPVCVDDVTTILDAKKPLEDNNVHIFPIGKYNKYLVDLWVKLCSPNVLIFIQKVEIKYFEAPARSITF